MFYDRRVVCRTMLDRFTPTCSLFPFATSNAPVHSLLDYCFLAIRILNVACNLFQLATSIRTMLGRVHQHVEFLRNERCPRPRYPLVLSIYLRSSAVCLSIGLTWSVFHPHIPSVSARLTQMDFVQVAADKKAAQDTAKEDVARNEVQTVEDCKLKTKSSNVWDHFHAPKLYNGSKKAKCKICDKLISAVNTTNLRSHMNSVHKSEVAKALVESENVSTCPRFSHMLASGSTCLICTNVLFVLLRYLLAQATLACQIPSSQVKELCKSSTPTASCKRTDPSRGCCVRAAGP